MANAKRFCAGFCAGAWRARNIFTQNRVKIFRPAT
jgi:hypothetical protein